jgi:hypothetical protein
VSAYWPLLAIGIVVVGLMVWTIVAKRGPDKALKAASERLGFRPCPEQREWLKETVGRVENNREFQYEVHDPKRWGEEPAVYFYEKIAHRASHHDKIPIAQREILFPLKRPAAGALVIAVKPSSLETGVASRLIGAVATGPWDSQPDDLTRLELPRDLAGSNLIGALGPPGASFYDIADADLIAVAQGIGDAGGLVVRVRDDWCSISSASTQIPFRLDELVARIRPLM